MFHEFPYTNIHDLNIDWILKIMKEFFDKYHTIDEFIEAAQNQLTSKTDELIAQLIAKSAELTTAYNENATEKTNEFSTIFLNALDELRLTGDAQVDAVNITSQNAQNTINSLIETLPSDFTDITKFISYIIPENILLPYIISRTIEGYQRTVTIDKYKISIIRTAGNSNPKLYNLFSTSNPQQVYFSSFTPTLSDIIPINILPSYGRFYVQRTSANPITGQVRLGIIFCNVDNDTVTVVDRKFISLSTVNTFNSVYYDITIGTNITHFAMIIYTSNTTDIDVEFKFGLLPYNMNIKELETRIETLENDSASYFNEIARLSYYKTPLPIVDNDISFGQNGQVLATDGNGNTSWINPATPTQQELDNAIAQWLQAHPEATTTVDFTIVRKVYSTLQQAQADSTLTAGDLIETLGYFSSGDNGGTKYIIRNDAPTGPYERIGNLYAEMQPNKYLTPEMFGAKGDGITDDGNALYTALNYAYSLCIPVIISAKTYITSITLDVKQGTRLIGYNNSLCCIKYTGANVCIDLYAYAEIDGVYILANTTSIDSIGINCDYKEVATSGSTRRNINIKNCRIRNFRKAAINLNNEWQVNIDNCYIYGPTRSGTNYQCCGIRFDYDGALLSAWAGSGNLITNTYIDQCYYGIYNRGGWDVTLINDIFEHCYWGYYKAAEGNATNIIGCWFEDFGPSSSNPTAGHGVYGKTINIFACRRLEEFDIDNSVYGIITSGANVTIGNLRFKGTNGNTYKLDVDSEGNVIAIQV